MQTLPKKVDGLMKVLFCGKHFPWAMRLTREELAAHPNIQCSDCEPSQLEQSIADAHVVLPFMTRLDEATISKGRELRCVLQYGVGLEGVGGAVCGRAAADLTVTDVWLMRTSSPPSSLT